MLENSGVNLGRAVSQSQTNKPVSHLSLEKRGADFMTILNTFLL
jgi:hypothetical protein